MPDVAGVSFDDVHSYREWGLKLKKIKIGLPEEKTAFVDVAGMNGCLDLTETQNGGVVYGTRKLEFVFDARDCSYQGWAWLVSKIARSIHGGKKKIVLDTDQDYFYTGRCAINTSKTNEVTAEITVTCTCDPFKMSCTPEEGKWLWDPFSFIDGVIREAEVIQINSASGWQEVKVYGWAYNEALEIRSSAGMKVRFGEAVYEILEGTNIMVQFDILEGENSLYFQGSGGITVIQRGGMI